MNPVCKIFLYIIDNTMNITNPSAKECFRQLNLVFTAYLLGVILFSGVVVFTVIKNDGGLLSSGMNISRIMKLVFALMIVVLIPAAFFLHRNNISKIETGQSVEKKMIIYRNSFIIKAGIIEFLCIANTVILLLVGDIYLLIPLVLLIFYLIINRPGTYKISLELSLTPEDKKSISS